MNTSHKYIVESCLLGTMVITDTESDAIEIRCYINSMIQQDPYKEQFKEFDLVCIDIEKQPESPTRTKLLKAGITRFDTGPLIGWMEIPYVATL